MILKAQSKVVDRYLTTIPVAVRNIFALSVGDSFEWEVDTVAGSVKITPMRLNVLTPQMTAFLESDSAQGETQIIADVEAFKQQVAEKHR